MEAIIIPISIFTGVVFSVKISFKVIATIVYELTKNAKWRGRKIFRAR